MTNNIERPFSSKYALSACHANSYISLLCLQKYKHPSMASLDVPYRMKPPPIFGPLGISFVPSIPANFGTSHALFITVGLLIAVLYMFPNKL